MQISNQMEQKLTTIICKEITNDPSNINESRDIFIEEIMLMTTDTFQYLFWFCSELQNFIWRFNCLFYHLLIIHMLHTAKNCIHRNPSHFYQVLLNVGTIVYIFSKETLTHRMKTPVNLTREFNIGNS